ncbi:hypothetical protein DLAC_10248 [Tieghemostelium lacteum]|uniref:Uncharacterized protein n=1 Tax=Tieghemostelium lacteum TaxID=361077 RepID=A0A151Z4Y8_TIELA|nr:hypothetical protein DLAC_10248 [Tieghemostelium lacteum]|eukprot:KYQ89026.1 hypothetical protein DLAC_10248 [Tieghemostelium lacteum]
MNMLPRILILEILILLSHDYRCKKLKNYLQFIGNLSVVSREFKDYYIKRIQDNYIDIKSYDSFSNFFKIRNKVGIKINLFLHNISLVKLYQWAMEDNPQLYRELEITTLYINSKLQVPTIKPSPLLKGFTVLDLILSQASVEKVFNDNQMEALKSISSLKLNFIEEYIYGKQKENPLPIQRYIIGRLCRISSLETLHLTGLVDIPVEYFKLLIKSLPILEVLEISISQKANADRDKQILDVLVPSKTIKELTIATSINTQTVIEFINANQSVQILVLSKLIFIGNKESLPRIYNSTLKYLNIESTDKANISFDSSIYSLWEVPSSLQFILLQQTNVILAKKLGFYHPNITNFVYNCDNDFEIVEILKLQLPSLKTIQLNQTHTTFNNLAYFTSRVFQSLQSSLYLVEFHYFQQCDCKDLCTLIVNSPPTLKVIWFSYINHWDMSSISKSLISNTHLISVIFSYVVSAKRETDSEFIELLCQIIENNPRLSTIKVSAPFNQELPLSVITRFRECIAQNYQNLHYINLFTRSSEINKILHSYQIGT